MRNIGDPGQNQADERDSRLLPEGTLSKQTSNFPESNASRMNSNIKLAKVSYEEPATVTGGDGLEAETGAIKPTKASNRTTTQNTHASPSPANSGKISN